MKFYHQDKAFQQTTNKVIPYYIMCPMSYLTYAYFSRVLLAYYYYSSILECP